MHKAFIFGISHEVTNMYQYTFYTHDYFTNSGEYSITGKHYMTLLKHCFQFSGFFSIIIYNEKYWLLQKLEKWRIVDFPHQTVALTQISWRYFYKICPEMLGVILASKQNLFAFPKNSQEQHIGDPAFLRKDGTVFFDSVIREGEYSIYPRSEEDVGAILKFGHWLPIDKFGIPESPAHEHQLIPARRQEIKLDSLYIMLQEIRESPSKYLTAPTIYELILFIQKYRPVNCKGVSMDWLPQCSFVPPWYRAFELYVLGELNAMTNTPVSDAFENAGYCSERGYAHFYELLDVYLAKICTD